MSRSLIGSLATLLLVLGAGSAPAGFINGHFDRGNLTSWTTYTLDGGTIGTPAAVLADVAGTGTSQAARLQVGDAGHLVGLRQGGGMLQSLTLQAGTYHFSIDLASERPVAVANADGGRFELLVDGAVMASHDFGYLAANTTERQHLETELQLSDGPHEFRLQWSRSFRGDSQTPYQFMDNAVLTLDSPSGLNGPGEGSGLDDGPSPLANPVPGSVVLFGMGLVTLGAGRLVRRRLMRG